MNMDGQIRVKTDVMYKELYNDLKDCQVIGDFHELFFACACLGYHHNKRKPIKRGDDRFWSKTILPREWACYYAMLIEQNNNDFSIIADDKKVIGVIEEYANAGIEFLIQDFLDDYLHASGKETMPQLERSCCKELPKRFLHYLFEQSEGPQD